LPTDDIVRREVFGPVVSDGVDATSRRHRNVPRW
jgi:hypothetical protein